MSHLIPVSDELWVVNSTIATAETGTPQLKPSNNQIAYNSNYPTEGYIKTKQYKVEYYLRAFVYKIAEKLDIEWKYLSNLFYFFLFAFIPLFLYIFFKKTILPLPVFAFLFVLIGLSVWASSSFHYLRYYSFTLIFVLVCHILATYCYLRLQQPLWKKIPIILLITWIPGGLIHTANYVLPAFWTLFSVLIILQKIFLSTDISQKNKTKSLMVLVSLFLIAVFLMSEAANNLLPFGNGNPIRQFIGRLNKVDFSFTAVEAFAELNFNTSIWGILTNFFIVGFAIWQLPILKKSGIFFWKITLALTVFSFTLLFFLLDNNYVGYAGYNRYFFVVHVQYLLFLALCFTVLYRFLVKNIKKSFLGKRILIFGIIVTPFVFGFLPLSNLPSETYNFSILPRLTTNYQTQVQNLARQEKTLVITNHALFTLSLLDKNPVFLLSQYPDTLNTIPPNSTISLGERKKRIHGGERIYQKQSDGIVIGSYGLPLIGNRKDFCQTLTSYSDWNILLLMHEYHYTPKMELSLEKEIKRRDYLYKTLIKPAEVFYYEICKNQ